MSSYTVKSGDTLNRISLKTLGTASKWKKIVSANPQLAGRKTAIDGSPLIFPGDVLVIPEESTLPNITNKKPISVDKNEAAENNFSIFINGKLFTGFSGYSLKITADSLDQFSFSAPWENEELKKAVRPFSFSECSVFYDRKIVFQGRLLSSAPEVSPDNRTVTIQGYPLCGVLNDCDLPASKYPASYNGLKLDQIASDVCEPFGISVSFDGSVGAVFDKVEYEIGTKLLEFLKKLAEQRNFFFTNKEDGSLQFLKKYKEESSVSFLEGDLYFISCKPSFNEQAMYSHLTGFSKTEKNQNAASYTYENQFLIKEGIFRPFSFVCEDVDEKGIESAVKMKAGEMFVSACTYDLTVYGCTDRNGKIFKKGMKVSVFAPNAMIYRETKFQVRDMEIKKSDSEGIMTSFKLVLPDSIEGKLPDKLPWLED